MTLDQILSLGGIVVSIAIAILSYQFGVKQGERSEQLRDEARRREVFSIRLKFCLSQVAVNPMPHSETSMEIELTLTNIGEMTVFLKSASLVAFREQEGRFSLGFLGSTEKTKPKEFQANEQLVITYKAGTVYQVSNSSPRIPVKDKDHRTFEFDLIEKVCNGDAFFEVVTSRDTYKFPAKDVCEGDIQMWPRYYPKLKEGHSVN